MRGLIPLALLLMLAPFVAPAARPTPTSSIVGSLGTTLDANGATFHGALDTPTGSESDAAPAPSNPSALSSSAKLSWGGSADSPSELAPLRGSAKMAMGNMGVASTGSLKAATAPAPSLGAFLTGTAKMTAGELADDSAASEEADSPSAINLSSTIGGSVDPEQDATTASLTGGAKMSVGKSADDSSEVDVADYAPASPSLRGAAKFSAGDVDVDSKWDAEPAEAPATAALVHGSTKMSFKNPTVSAAISTAPAAEPSEQESESDATDPVDESASEEPEEPVGDGGMLAAIGAALAAPAFAPASAPAAAPLTMASAPAPAKSAASAPAPAKSAAAAPAPAKSAAIKAAVALAPAKSPASAPAPAETAVSEPVEEEAPAAEQEITEDRPAAGEEEMASFAPAPAPMSAFAPAPAMKKSEGTLPLVQKKVVPTMTQKEADAAIEEDFAPAPAPVAAKAGPLVQKKVVPTMTEEESDAAVEETPAPAPAPAKKVVAKAPTQSAAKKAVAPAQAHAALHAPATVHATHQPQTKVHSPVRPRAQEKKEKSSTAEPPSLNAPQFKEETPMWSEPDTPDLPIPALPQPSATASLNLGRDSFDLGFDGNLLPGAKATFSASGDAGSAAAAAQTPAPAVKSEGPAPAAGVPSTSTPAAVEPMPMAESTNTAGFMPQDVIGNFGRDMMNVTTKAIKLAGAVFGQPNNTVKAAAPKKVQSTEDLHQLNEAQLQQVFNTGTAEMPGGKAGSAACTGEGLTNFATKDTLLYGENAPFYSLWKGKVFYTDPATGTTKIWNLLNNNNTVMAIGDATILPQGMSPDKKDSIIINYNRSEAIMFRPLRDEIRKVGDNTYLGRAWVLNPVQGYKPSHPIPGTQPILNAVEPALNATLMAALRTVGFEGDNSLPEEQGGWGKYETGEPFPVLWFAMGCEDDAVQRLHYSTAAQMLTGFARDAGWQPSNFSLPALNQRAGANAATEERTIPDVGAAAAPAVTTIRDIATTGHADAAAPTLAAQAASAVTTAMKDVRNGEVSRRVAGSMDNVMAGVMEGVQPAAGSVGTAIAGALNSVRPAGLPALPQNAVPGK